MFSGKFMINLASIFITICSEELLQVSASTNLNSILADENKSLTNDLCFSEPWKCKLDYYLVDNWNKTFEIRNEDIQTALFNKSTKENTTNFFVSYGTCHSIRGFYIMMLYGFNEIRCSPLSIEPFITNDIISHFSHLEDLYIILHPDLLSVFLYIMDQEITLRNFFFYIIGINEREFQTLKLQFPHLILQKAGTNTSASILREFISSVEENQNFTTKRNGLHQRRSVDRRANSLRKLALSKRQKRVIRVVTTWFPPYIEQMTSAIFPKCSPGHQCDIPDRDENQNITKWRKSCCSGMSIEIFELLAKELDFEYTLYAVEDEKFGSQENGTWNGMVGALVRNNADVAINVLSIISKRATAVHFTSHYLESSFGILRIKQQVIPFPSWEFLKPLTVELELVILLCTLVSIMIIMMLENVGYMMKANQRFSFREVMTYVFGLTFQRDMGGTNPRMWSGRLAALGYASAMTIIMSIYTARITANSIAQNVNDDFKGFKDEKNPKPDYKFSTVGGLGYSQELYFENHDDESFRRMHRFMKPYFVKDDEVGIRMLLAGKLQAFITELGSFEAYFPPMLARIGCSQEIEFYPKSVGKHGLGFAYRKGFAFGKTISNLMVKMREHGVFEDLKIRWYSSSPCDGIKPVEQFNWTYFSGILVIMGVMSVIGIGINLFEHSLVFFRKLYLKRKEEKTTKHSIQDKTTDLKRGNTDNGQLVKANRNLSLFLEDLEARIEKRNRLI